MVIIYLLNVTSDIAFAFASILFVEAFGIDKRKGLKYQIFTAVFVFSFSTLMYQLFNNDHRSIPVLIYPALIVLSYLIVFHRIDTAKIYIAFLSEFISYLFSSAITYIYMRVTNESFELSNIVSLFAARLLLLIAAIVINSKDYAKRLYSISKNIPKYIWVLIMISLICVGSISDLINFPTINLSKELIITIFVFLLAICLICIVFSLLINVASKNYYTALNTLLEKQVSAQIAHYEKLEKLSSDMRTFRHDYINHLSSISALITEGFYDDAQGYIDRLTESTHRNETIFRTGNRLADAILTDKSENCKAFADIVFDGCITDKIGNSDICIILANALDNATEACKSCPERGRISIESQVRQGYWKMVMRNPTVGADSEGIMKTSKEDERNHGFGLLSIEQAVKRYDGTMSVSIKNGVFELAVVLKLPMEKPQ